MLGGDGAPLVASVLSPLEMGNEPHILGLPTVCDGQCTWDVCTYTADF